VFFIVLLYVCVYLCVILCHFVCVILCIFVFLCDILLPSGVINADRSILFSFRDVTAGRTLTDDGVTDRLRRTIRAYGPISSYRFLAI